ncbi:MAG: type II toxin-antitoxin system MqsA family antitoxin [Methanoregulaceae archaeon]
MKCVICRKGETKAGRTTVTFDHGGLTLVVREVPAQICTTCGEEYVDEKAAKEILAAATRMEKTGTQAVILKYQPEFEKLCTSLFG